jgi:hypothetical protein
VATDKSGIWSPACGEGGSRLQPAFRNKKDLSEADRKQLAELQEELDKSDAVSGE